MDLNQPELEFIPSRPTTGRLGISRGKHTERLCGACVQINQTPEYGASKLNRKCLLTHLREPAASPTSGGSGENSLRRTCTFLCSRSDGFVRRVARPVIVSATVSDGYYEDTAGECGAVSAGEVLTIEAILAKYGVIVVDGG